jgi:hypothetical protein
MVLVLLWPCNDRSTPTRVTWGPLSPEAEAAPIPTAHTIEEMLRGSKGRSEHWSTAPELVILTSVMQFQPGGSSEYIATADVLTDGEVDDLVADLTAALRLLTANAFDQFAAVRREAIAPGASTRVIRTHQIVVGRYRGVLAQSGILGLGGRAARDGGITGAAVILDDEYDRSGPLRARLRTHELGHALGFNHVESRESIMNPHIGPDATALDRQIATLAYRAPTSLQVP